MVTVDVIVPCYRYGRFLRQCVMSALSQSDVRVRVLILDDASPDETPEVARALMREDARVTYDRHVRNRGHIATYNEGLEWATGDYTLLLSADDWVLPGAFARAVAVMEADPSVGLVHGNAIELSEDGPVLEEAQADLAWTVQDGEAFLRECRLHNPVVVCTAVVRTELQKRIGGYKPELPHSGDLEMWMRFALHSRIAKLRAVQGVYRRHVANMSNDYYRNPLRDLEQRAAAIDHFMQSAGDALPKPEEVHGMLRRGLAEATLSSVGAQHESFDEAMKFARSIDPTIDRTLAWRKKHVKHWLLRLRESVSAGLLGR